MVPRSVRPTWQTLWSGPDWPSPRQRVLRGYDKAVPHRSPSRCITYALHTGPLRPQGLVIHRIEVQTCLKARLGPVVNPVKHTARRKKNADVLSVHHALQKVQNFDLSHSRPTSEAGGFPPASDQAASALPLGSLTSMSTFGKISPMMFSRATRPSRP